MEGKGIEGGMREGQGAERERGGGKGKEGDLDRAEEEKGVKLGQQSLMSPSEVCHACFGPVVARVVAPSRVIPLSPLFLKVF